MKMKYAKYRKQDSCRYSCLLRERERNFSLVKISYGIKHSSILNLPQIFCFFLVKITVFFMTYFKTGPYYDNSTNQLLCNPKKYPTDWLTGWLFQLQKIKTRVISTTPKKKSRFLISKTIHSPHTTKLNKLKVSHHTAPYKPLV